MDVTLKGVRSMARAERLVDTGLNYDGVRPVRVHVSKREARYRLSDGGAAVDAAGGVGDVAYPEQLTVGRQVVNVSRQGVVWLPAVTPTDEWLITVCDLVAKGSVALYEHLLDLDDQRGGLPALGHADERT